MGAAAPEAVGRCARSSATTQPRHAAIVRRLAETVQFFSAIMLRSPWRTTCGGAAQDPVPLGRRFSNTGTHRPQALAMRVSCWLQLRPPRYQHRPPLGYSRAASRRRPLSREGRTDANPVPSTLPALPASPSYSGGTVVFELVARLEGGGPWRAQASRRGLPPSMAALPARLATVDDR